MYYPIMMNIKGKNVVVIGGGRVAYQKLIGLEGTEANLTIISPTIIPEIKEWMKHNNAKWIEKTFEPIDIEQANIIIATTNDSATNHEIRIHKKEHQLLLLADNPKDSDFITPATIKRGKLNISISTGGASPSLAKKIKKDLEQQFDEKFEDYIEFLDYARHIVLNQIADRSLRKKLLTQLLDSKFYNLTVEGDIIKRNEIFKEMLQQVKGQSF